VQSFVFGEGNNILAEYQDWVYSQFGVSSGYVFWINDKTVYRLADSEGAAPEAVLTIDGSRGLFADSSLVYLADAEALWTMPLAGGTRTLLRRFDDAYGVDFASTSGDSIYGVDLESDLVKMPKAGGAWQRLGLRSGALRLLLTGSHFVIGSRRFAGSRITSELVAGDVSAAQNHTVVAKGSPLFEWHAWGISSAGIFLEYEDTVYRAPLVP
jgi:hypothetical protein